MESGGEGPSVPARLTFVWLVIAGTQLSVHARQCCIGFMSLKSDRDNN